MLSKAYCLCSVAWKSQSFPRECNSVVGLQASCTIMVLFFCYNGFNNNNCVFLEGFAWKSSSEKSLDILTIFVRWVWCQCCGWEDEIFQMYSTEKPLLPTFTYQCHIHSVAEPNGLRIPWHHWKAYFKMPYVAMIHAVLLMIIAHASKMLY